jgi:hypothetical protein
MRSSMKFAAAILISVSLGSTLTLAIPAPAVAQQTTSWNGTWIGNWAGGNGTQIVFAENELIAMYWDGDYLTDPQSSLSPDGKVVTITWPSGQALLTRDGEAGSHIVVHETGRPDATFDVKRDNQ